MDETFLNGRVVLHPGNSLDVLAQIEECSVHSCVTDPPYHLTSIVQRFGAENAAPAQFGTDGRYARASAGFMGKVWDGGDVAFRPETWRAVFRVLKPGAHLIAMGGTRTYHRLACAIEDAGFEIRDTISWLYGSGFPKSHDVSKGIDRAAGAERAYRIDPRWADKYPNGPKGGDPSPMVRQAARSDEPLMTSDAATDAARQWQGWGSALKPAMELCVLARKPLSEGTIAANVLRWGTGAINVNACRVRTADDSTGGNDRSHTSDRRTSIQNNGHQERSSPVPVSDSRHSANGSECVRDDQQSLNLRDDYHPSFRFDDEPPHSGTEDDQASARQQADGRELLGPGAIAQDNRDYLSTSGDDTAPYIERQGRWPANVAHDGSDEVVAAFPDSNSAAARIEQNNGRADESQYRIKPTPGTIKDFGDTGSAARFFYTAKADADDRLGSKHPTVKPLDLMQWLVRLVTPKGGTCLDPFAGTGTTGEAAWREGCNALLIEAEPEYQADIRRRMALALAGPDERQRESIKARNLPRDDGPLFSRETWAEMWAKPFDFSQEPK